MASGTCPTRSRSTSRSRAPRQAVPAESPARAGLFHAWSPSAWGAAGWSEGPERSFRHVRRESTRGRRGRSPPAHGAALRRTAARCGAEGAQKLAMLANDVPRNIHYWGLFLGLRSANVVLAVRTLLSMGIALNDEVRSCSTVAISPCSPRSTRMAGRRHRRCGSAGTVTKCCSPRSRGGASTATSSVTRGPA